MFKRAVVLLSILCVAGVVHAKGEDDGKATINGKVRSIVATKFGKQQIEGRVSAFLRLDPAEFDKGRVKVGAFNVLYTGVDQALITGRKSKNKPFGTLGYVITANKKGQFLDYDPQSLTLKGEIFGSVAISQFSELIEIQRGKDEHDIDSVSQNARLSISIQLDRPLDINISSDKIASFSGNIEFNISIDADTNYQLFDYRINGHEMISVEFEVIWWPIFEVAKKLCLQPVQIGTLFFDGLWPPTLSVTYTGDGWTFGLPGANQQWAKADVIFETRTWKTIFNSSYSTLSQSEATLLRGEVDDDDCVEIFFVDQLSPNSLWGGGATWNGGTADTKIISSDENSDYGIDFTHLAHELGHAMTLKHPGSGYPIPSQPHRIDGSTGTLMCPSGFMNDNPAVNSQWNKDSVQNPLFQFALKVISSGPDCQNDVDCGACP